MDKKILSHLSKYTVIPLAGDASARKYSRVKSREGKDSWVLCADDNIKDESLPFLQTQKIFLKNQLTVPKVLEVDVAQKCYLQEDVGDVSLNEIEDPTQRLKYYLAATQMILKIQQIKLGDYPDAPFENLFFDHEKYAFEFQMTKKY